MAVTNRDIEMMTYLAEQGVATADQLAERFFPTRKACLWRLMRLIQAELIESVPVTALKELSLGAYKSAVSAVGLNLSHHWKRRVYRLGPRFRERRIGAEAVAGLKMMRHQLQTNGIRKICERRFPGALILTEADVEAEWRRYKTSGEVPLPDLVIREPGREVAIEVERTMKSQSVYYFRFALYEQSHYTHVIYFCETPEIFNKVSKIASDSKKIGVSSLLMTDKVFRHTTGMQPIEAFLGIASYKEVPIERQEYLS